MVLRVIPVNVTMIVRRKYLVITGTGTLLEIPVASIMVEGAGRLWWSMMAIQSQPRHCLPSELHLLCERFLVTQHPLYHLSAQIHLGMSCC